MYYLVSIKRHSCLAEGRASRSLDTERMITDPPTNNEISRWETVLQLARPSMCRYFEHVVNISVSSIALRGYLAETKGELFIQSSFYVHFIYMIGDWLNTTPRQIVLSCFHWDILITDRKCYNCICLAWLQRGGDGTAFDRITLARGIGTS